MNLLNKEAQNNSEIGLTALNYGQQQQFPQAAVNQYD